MRLKALFIALAVVLFGNPLLAQFTVTHVFTPGTPILSSEVNANFALLSEAVNRKGGTVTGNISVNADITIDGIDLSDFLLAGGEIRANTAGTAGAPSFSRTGDTTTGIYFPAAGALGFALSGTERMKLDGNGLTVFGNNVLNSAGKIPGFTSTYFASLDGSAITNVPEANIIDGAILARVATDETITGSWTHALGTITTDRKIANYTATWNDSGVTFTGINVDVTNSASAAASKVFKVSVGGSERFSVGVDGVTSMSSFQLTASPTNGYVLTSDGSGNASWQALPAGATGVPAGMVAWFESSCPSGWTRRSGAGETYENKFIRGGAAYSAAGGGADTHTHSVDPANTTSTSGGSHTHTFDVGAATSSSNGDHSHSVSGSTGLTNIDHTHGFTTGGPSSTSAVPLGGFLFGSDSHTHSGTTDSGGGSHSHSVSITTATQGAHTHSFDAAAVTSSDHSAAHTHDVNVASFSSGSGSNVPAYVQVVVCKKD